MKRFRGWRLLLAALIALLLPFPGPHVDSYLPLAAVLWSGIGDAPAGFFLLAGVILSVYIGAVYGLIVLVMFLVGRRNSGRRGLR